MNTLLQDDLQSLEQPEGKIPVIQHDFSFYSVVYYSLSTRAAVYFLNNPLTGKFKRLEYGHWYMCTALEKLNKIPANEKHLITEELVNEFWYAIREGYNHMLDPNLKNEYDIPRIQNTLKAIRSYIKRIADKGEKNDTNSI